MAHIRYQPEIDGLRAIAVLAVVLYHAGFSTVGGGYVGVDVFFVISGYLITNLIVREVRETGGFQFGRFYLRRIRRLFPALLCTTLFSWAGAFIFFSPDQLQDFGASAIAALVSLSNVYFWFEADYFDAAAITKPLLHTWSLSVEEQFYLIWPALIVFVLAKLRGSFAIAALAVVGFASIALAQYWLQVDRDAAFYLLPARVAELAIGAALVWLPKRDKVPVAILEFGALAGLAMVGWAVFTYNHDTPFPGVTSLLPCFGTALFIACSQARFAGAALRLPPMVWVGKISYSLYLVHWPIIVFYAIITQTNPNTVGAWLITGLSLILGWMQYQHVEARYRYGGQGNQSKDLRFAGWAAACIALVAIPSWVAYNFGGMEWRLPENRRAEYTVAEWRQVVKKKYCREKAPEGTFAGDNTDLVTCQLYRGKQNDVFIWGDSHALHLVAGFARGYPAYNIYVLYMNGCVPQSGFARYVRDFGSSDTQACVARNRKVLEMLSAAERTNIVVTSAKRSSPRAVIHATKELLEPLKKAGHNVAFLADFIRPGRSLPDCVAVPDYALTNEDISERCSGHRETVARELRYNRALAKLLPETIPVNDLQCFENTCKFFHRGQLLYRDSHHLNVYGSEYYVNLLKPRLPIAKIDRRKKRPKLADKADKRSTGSVGNQKLRGSTAPTDTN